jgi:hypothetical protein
MTEKTKIKRRVHIEKVQQKRHKVEMLLALIETHERSDKPDTKYLRHLKSRFHSAQTQLEAMLP